MHNMDKSSGTPSHYTNRDHYTNIDIKVQRSQRESCSNKTYLTQGLQECIASEHHHRVWDGVSSSLYTIISPEESGLYWP